MAEAGIIYSGTTSCAFPGCAGTFTKVRVTDRYCPAHQGNKHAAEILARNKHEIDFVMIDGEGSGDGLNHKYVLLGCGQEQIENPNGLNNLAEIFSFLYGEFEKQPRATFAGFYLGYDFNMWLKLLPRDRAYYLLTEAGRSRRRRICRCRNKSKCKHMRIAPHPVEFRGWQLDILGYKRMRIRPKRCACEVATCKCPGQAAWMYINDAGPFFQASLLTVINPESWNHPIVTPDEYATILEGKSSRGTAQLDNNMRRYNCLENEVGARLLTELNRGFTSAGIRLNKKQWFGPGQAAQAWMHLDGKLEITTQSVRKMPRARQRAIIATYYGGWFELTCHGHIPGITWEYDINSAYPSIAARMPCMCGKWTNGTGIPGTRLSHAWLTSGKPSRLRLCHVTVSGKSPYLGPLPYRGQDGTVYRPRHATGWYWQHEIDAARNAGLISDVTYYSWHEYSPCGHHPPLRGLAGLYEGRLRKGKDTPEGKAYKLVYNSVYGKLAQSLGDPVYSNPVYASLITSGCRTMILHAIASHPDKAAAVVMVATDGVYFMTHHPVLDGCISNRMGDWSRAEKHDLTLFKPGVYWDSRSRELINAGKAPKFKSRGVNARDFAESIASVDAEFDTWNPDDAPNVQWPAVTFKARFSQVSVLQALQWTADDANPAAQHAKYKRLAGQVTTGKELCQDSKPGTKRNPETLAFDAVNGVWRTEPWDHRGWPESAAYERKFGLDVDGSEWEEYATPDGSVMLGFREALYAG